MKKIIVFAVVVLFYGVSMFSIFVIGGKDSNRIDIRQAMAVGKAKLHELNKQDFTIESVEEVPRLFYILHLFPHGYIIVGANRNLPPIIAYSFTSNFTVEDENIFLQILEVDIKLRLENVQYMPENIIEKRHHMWNNLLNWKSTINNFQQWPPEGSTTTEGWIESRWHQKSPYNDFCPMDKKAGKRSVAGCPAIPMAQILNYHRTTNNVAFNDSDDYYHNYGGNRYWIVMIMMSMIFHLFQS